MKRIHLFIDFLDVNYGIKTNQVEMALRLFFEAILLVLCAIPSVNSTGDGVVQFVVGMTRLHLAENSRAKTSILGRAIEEGKIPPRPKLAPDKEELLEQIAWHELAWKWIWPVVVPITAAVASGNPNAICGALLLGIGASLGRAVYDTGGMGWWRASRVAWKKERAAMPEFDEDAQYRGRWFGDISKMNFGKKRGPKP